MTEFEKELFGGMTQEEFLENEKSFRKSCSFQKMEEQYRYEMSENKIPEITMTEFIQFPDFGSWFVKLFEFSSDSSNSIVSNSMSVEYLFKFILSVIVLGIGSIALCGIIIPIVIIISLINLIKVIFN